MFTEMSANGTVTLREKRPFLLVSSTSWTGKELSCLLDFRKLFFLFSTVDEDFGLLLEALTCECFRGDGGWGGNEPLQLKFKKREKRCMPT